MQTRNVLTLKHPALQLKIIHVPWAIFAKIIAPAEVLKLLRYLELYGDLLQLMVAKNTQVVIYMKL